MYVSDDYHTHQRVRYVGISGISSIDLVGRVSRVYRTHVRVRWDNGLVEQVHPDHIRPVR